MRSPTRLIALGTLIVFFIAGITACGKISFVSPLDRPLAGESMRLYPLSLAEKNQSNPRTVLFFKISDSGQYRKIKSFDIGFNDQDFGKSQQLNVPLASLRSMQSDHQCLNGQKNLEDFIQSNPDLLLVCDPVITSAIKRAKLVNLNYDNGTSHVLTGLSAARTIHDNLDIAVYFMGQ